MKKTLLENIQSNLKEDEEVSPKMYSLNKLKEYYIESCEAAELTIKEVIEDLFNHKCINAKYFAIMTEELIDYFEDNDYFNDNNE